MKQMLRSFVFLLVLISTHHAAALSGLTGSYTSLPQSMKSLSLLDGAAAIENNMLMRLILLKNGTTPAIKYLKKLFHIIPPNDELRLSKKYAKAWDELIQDLATIFVIHWLIKKDTDACKEKLAGKLTKHLPRAIHIRDGEEYEILRLATLGALWSIQKIDATKTTQGYLITLCKAITQTIETIITNHQPTKGELHTLCTLQNEATTVSLELKNSSKNKATPAIETVLKSSSGRSTAKVLFQKLTDEEYQQVITLFLRKKIAEGHPEALVYKTQTTSVTINGQTYHFSDCIETLIRNLINLLAYNASNKELSAATLKQKFPYCNPKFIQFYETYPHIDAAQTTPETLPQCSEEAYNDWAQLMSNIPDVEYVHANGYEVKSRLTNIVAILNHVLGIGSTNATKLTTSEQIQYLTNLFGGYFAHKQKDGTQIITITSSKGFSFVLNISSGHGTMKYIPQKPFNPIFSSNLFTKYPTLWQISLLEDWPISPASPLALFAHPIEGKTFSKELPKKIKKIPSLWLPFLFAHNKKLNVFSSQELIAFEKAIIKHLADTDFCEETENLIKKISQDSLEYDYQLSVLMLKKGVICPQSYEKTSEIATVLQLWKKGLAYDKTLETIQTLIADANPRRQYQGLYLFYELLSHFATRRKSIKTYESATLLLNTLGNISSTLHNKNMINQAETLANNLKSSNTISSEINTAAAGLHNANYFIRAQAAKIFQILLEENPANKEIIKTIISCTKSNIPGKINAEGLLKKHGEVCNRELRKGNKEHLHAANNIACTMLSSKDSLKQQQGVTLFTTLVKSIPKRAHTPN